MESGWDFNCPQFVDFSSGPTLLNPDDNADKYFDFDHENGIPVAALEDVTGEVFDTPQSEGRRTRSRAKTPQSTQAKVGTPQRVPRTRTPAKSVTDLNDGGTPTLPYRRTLVENKTSTVKTEKKETPKRVTRSNKLQSPEQDLADKVEDGQLEIKQEEEKEAVSRLANVCSSLEEWRKKTAGARETSQTQSRRSVPVKQPNQKYNTKRQNKSLDRPVTPQKKPKLTPSAEASDTSQPKPGSGGLKRCKSFAAQGNGPADSTSISRNHKRGLSTDRPIKAASTPSKTKSNCPSANKYTPNPETQRGRLTTKHTRGYSSGSAASANNDSKTAVASKQAESSNLKRKGVKMPATKNHEELELEKIAFFRQELAKKRKLAQESCKAALQGTSSSVTAPVKECTKPHEFHFSTDSRLKGQPTDNKQSVLEVKDFASILRSAKGKQAAATSKHGPTKPEPFHLSEQRKKEDPQGSKYVSMAEQVKAFSGTPDRFRSKPRAPPQQRGRSKSPAHGVTIPKTPQFETRTRSRPNSAPSRKDQEAKEIEEAQKHQFKAHPLNQKIFQNSSCGVKRVVSKPITVPVAFHLTSDNRHNRSHSKDKNQEQYEFHAQPLNKKILEGTVGVKEAKRLPITNPESPAFALKHRARIPVLEDSKVEKPASRARAVPHFGIPFQPQVSHKVTEPEPFGFEARDKRRAVSKAHKIEQVIDEENRQREFYAQPLPSYEANLPSKRTKPLTVHQPFNLDTDNRGKKKAEEWGAKLEEELRQQKEKARFKANKPSVLEAEPFIPAKEHKHTTDISEFELNTAKRTMKREAFEMHKKAKQDEIDNIRRQEEQIKEAEASAESQRLRQQAVPRAHAIRHYKALTVQHSDKPLTEPQSPCFKTDSRLRLRAALHSDSMSSTASS